MYYASNETLATSGERMYYDFRYEKKWSLTTKYFDNEDYDKEKPAN